MGYSSKSQFEEKILETTKFLKEEADSLVEDLKDNFDKSIRNRSMHHGFYRGAFDSGLRMRMTEFLRRTCSLQCGLSPEEGLVIVHETPVNSVINSIIDRSLK